MTSNTQLIAAKVRGIAAENRATQERVAEILGLSRQAVNLRFNGKIPFSATEILELSDTFGISLDRFFPTATDKVATVPLAVAS